ncbi:pheromone-regulated protein prm10 [Marasmius tenuissimus]|nr:pheromone-regulated protein prm10 [Marasmius tenuissimus]
MSNPRSDRRVPSSNAHSTDARPNRSYQSDISTRARQYSTAPAPQFDQQTHGDNRSSFRRTDSDIENGGVPQDYSTSGSFRDLTGILPGITSQGERKGSDNTLVNLEERPKASRKMSIASGISHMPSVLSGLHRGRRRSTIIRNVEDITLRRKFLLKLAKALLTFGAPSHRIQSQLAAASDILGGDAEFVHLPNIIIVSIRNGDGPSLTYFVRATGRVALTSLHQVHQIYRDVLHDNMGAEAGTQALRQLLREHPIYPLYVRCILAFFSASIICVVSFGGSFLDMWISGACACVLQYLGLSAANKSAMYANVYELISIIVAFVARALSNIPGNLFCYSAISSAGVVLILPGFTVLVSALELMSKNIFCGSVRIVYAIIYTLFLGFGLTIGSDFYLVVDRRARKAYYTTNNALTNLTYVHGHFEFSNGSSTSIHPSGVIGYSNPLSYDQHHIVKGMFARSSLRIPADLDRFNPQDATGTPLGLG